MKCHWPEVSRYCGLCDLRTGIYIKSVINVVIVVASVVTKAILMTQVMNLGRDFHEKFLIHNNHTANVTEQEIETMIGIRRIVIVFTLVWVAFKAGYIVITLCTVWAVYKKKAIILKILMYLCIPNWIFDMLLTSVAGIMLNLSIRVVMYICMITEVYNLVAIRSEYKSMIGKRVPEYGISDASSTYFRPPHDLSNLTRSPSFHCRTCTCFVSPQLDPVTTQPQPQNQENSITTPDDSPPMYEQKELNIKDVPIIFNQNQLAVGHSSVIDSDSVRNEPSTSRSVREDEKKIDITEIPVIYDESQLDLGSNPVVNDTREATTQSIQ